MKCEEYEYGICESDVGRDSGSLDRLILDRYQAGNFVFDIEIDVDAAEVKRMLDQAIVGYIGSEISEVWESLYEPNKDSMQHVWKYISPLDDYQDIEDDVDEAPPTKQNVYSWFLFNQPNKKLILIEAPSEEHAKELAYDEFGLKLDNFFSQRYNDVRSALAQYSLTETDLARTTSQYTIWSRTRDRNVRRTDMDGLSCCSCGNFYQFAIANQPGGKLKCFSCKNG